MDEVKKKPKSEKSSLPQDRVTLSPKISQRLDRWLSQLDEKFNGLIGINKSDLVNYFIGELAEDLSPVQISKIKTAYYDEVRFMQWALQKMKESKKNGAPLSLNDLLHLSQATSNDVVKRVKKPKSTESSAQDIKIDSIDLKNSSNEILAGK